jgi:hypothetical protein
MRWKMHFRRAYTLLFFRPEDVGLFAMLLTGDRVYLQMAGICDWSGTPAAFQMKHALKSRKLLYVADISGVGLAEDIEADLAEARRICVDLLGSTSVTDDKTEQGVCLDVIGYTINLTDKRVLIARKNILKDLQGYSSTDTGMNLKTAQRLASYGSRFGPICQVMRPFSTVQQRMR